MLAAVCMLQQQQHAHLLQQQQRQVGGVYADKAAWVCAQLGTGANSCVDIFLQIRQVAQCSSRSLCWTYTAADWVSSMSLAQNSAAAAAAAA
jgi:hypothetical protein